MKRTLVALMALIWLSASAQSQVVMPEAEFRRQDGATTHLQQIDYILVHCVPVPIGRHVIDPSKSTDKRMDRFVLNLVAAFEKAGILRVTVLSHKGIDKGIDWNQLLNATNYTLELELAFNDNVDQAQFSVSELGTGTKCLKVPPARIDRIIKIDTIKGGANLKWDGSVVYATYKRQPLSRQLASIVQNLQVGDFRPYYHIEMLEMLKKRVLFRYDIFTSQWRFIASDIGALNAPDFATNRVPEELQKD